MATARVTIDFAKHYPEWDAFRKQPAVVSMLENACSRIAAQADLEADMYVSALRRESFGPAEHHYEVNLGSKRARGTVWTYSYAAKLGQARANTLQNSLWRGAGAL